MSIPKRSVLLTLCLALAVGACNDDTIVEPVDGTVTGNVSADGVPMQGVIVSLEGPTSETNVTGDGGDYAFTDVAVGNYVVTIVQTPPELDVSFPDPDKNVSVTPDHPDATASFQGILSTTAVGAR